MQLWADARNMNIIYSFNKRGFDAKYWAREIAAASSDELTFIPFNHGIYLNPFRYIRAQLLDNLYFVEDPDLMRMYKEFEGLVEQTNADAVVVDCCNPYHPDYLRNVPIYKVLRIADGPISAYDRDFAYAHAYDHVLYHSPGYSRDMTMVEKLRYCGVKRADFWPLASFEARCDPQQTEDTIMRADRDVDIVFVGALYVNKMPLIAKIKRTFRRRCQIYGRVPAKKNLYYNVKHRCPGWIRELPADRLVPLYHRAKLGFNVHNRGKYTVGSYRFFDLPANGVMQVSDGGEYLDAFFEVGREIESYDGADELIAKIEYYLLHDDERRDIAVAGFRRVQKDHRMKHRMAQLAGVIQSGIAQRDCMTKAMCE